MFLFWYKWPFWCLIGYRVLAYTGLLNFIPFEETEGDMSLLSHIVLQIVFIAILFGVLQLKNKKNNKSTWEQLVYWKPKARTKTKKSDNDSGSS